MSTLYEYVVIVHTEDDESETDEIIEETRMMYADSENEVRVRAARFMTDDYDDEIDKVEILVRPF